MTESVFVLIWHWNKHKVKVNIFDSLGKLIYLILLCSIHKMKNHNRAKYFLKNCSRLLNPIPRRSITLKLLTLSRYACWYMYIIIQKVRNWNTGFLTSPAPVNDGYHDNNNHYHYSEKKISRLNNFYYADFCVKLFIFNWFSTVIVHQNFESQSSI